jgi:sodium/proline symporter
MHWLQFLSVALYFCVVFTIGFLSYRRHQSSTDFIIGGRSLNFWLTALAAHASDMSNWLFMGYPAAIFVAGLFGSWTAIGLILCMLINWHFVAPKVRIATEKYNSMTFSSFFESRLSDTSGLIRIFTAIMCFVFYSIYISAGLVGIGLLCENLFNLSYDAGIFVGIAVIVSYVLIGGYVTLAWIDLFQGIFLMCVIIFVPLYVIPTLGGWSSIKDVILEKKISLSLLPSHSNKTWMDVISIAAGWGLGYFGQPHIVTKFMGIKDVGNMYKSKRVGISWMVISLSAATLVGLIAIGFFPHGIKDAEQVFIKMVEAVFSPFLVGLMLCAVMAATINATSSQILVLASTLAEDFYKKLFRKEATSSEILLVSRLAIILAGILAFSIAFGKFSTIWTLVLYAWSGLGASFGPLLLFCLFSDKVNRYGAWAGIIAGGCSSAAWPLIDLYSPVHVQSLIVSFPFSCLCIYLVSLLTRHKSPNHKEPCP